jgi:hypothetical protein
MIKNLNTKTLMMLAVLSAGLLTALTGTGASMIAPAFAIDDDCEDNGDDSCTEENQRVHQENDCRIVNENEFGENSDSNTNTYSNNGNGDINCLNFNQSPDDGIALVDPDALDTIFGPVD